MSWQHYDSLRPSGRGNFDQGFGRGQGYYDQYYGQYHGHDHYYAGQGYYGQYYGQHYGQHYGQYYGHDHYYAGNNYEGNTEHQVFYTHDSYGGRGRGHGLNQRGRGQPRGNRGNQGARGTCRDASSSRGGYKDTRGGLSAQTPCQKFLESNRGNQDARGTSRDASSSRGGYKDTRGGSSAQTPCQKFLEGNRGNQGARGTSRDASSSRGGYKDTRGGSSAQTPSQKFLEGNRGNQGARGTSRDVSSSRGGYKDTQGGSSAQTPCQKFLEGNRGNQGARETSKDASSSRGGYKDTRGGSSAQTPSQKFLGSNKGNQGARGTSRDASSSRGGYKDTQGGSSAQTPCQKFLDFPFIEQQETIRLLPQFQVMFILRGLPGSGKSTIADALLRQYEDHAVVCSANYYCYDQNGKYVWHRHMLQETHSKCQQRAQKYAALKKPVLIIDNTNVRHDEVETYMSLAKQHGYVVVLVEPKTPWKFQARELSTRNKHNVSFAAIRRRIEQYDEILPHYCGWFVSPADCGRLKTMAKDVLWKCLQITDFQECIKAFSGLACPRLAVHDALSYYSIELSDGDDSYHVTACYSPQDRRLAGSSYHKSPAVVKALGQISQVSIIGCVVTKDTVSTRVSLTKKQSQLWMNDDETGLQRRRRGCSSRHEHSVEQLTHSLQHLPLDDEMQSTERPARCTVASSHITLGTRRDVSPVQAKYDVQNVVNYELSSRVFHEYTLQGALGTVRKYDDHTWAIYFNKEHVMKIPVIFSGVYD